MVRTAILHQHGFICWVGRPKQGTVIKKKSWALCWRGTTHGDFAWTLLSLAACIRCGPLLAGCKTFRKKTILPKRWRYKKVITPRLLLTLTSRKKHTAERCCHSAIGSPQPERWTLIRSRYKKQSLSWVGLKFNPIHLKPMPAAAAISFQLPNDLNITDGLPTFTWWRWRIYFAIHTHCFK